MIFAVVVAVCLLASANALTRYTYCRAARPHHFTPFKKASVAAEMRPIRVLLENPRALKMKEGIPAHQHQRCQLVS
jgi:hypothetical protein